MKSDNVYRATLTSARARTLWLGRTTSTTGDRVFAIAIIWFSWSSTHSPFGVAAVVLAESIPFLLWGLLRTRLSSSPSIRGLILLDVLRACLVAAMVFLPHGHSAAGAVLGLTAVGAVSGMTAAFEPAFRAMLPQLTQLPPRDTYTVFDLGGRIARIAGPAVAAALTFTAGPSGLLLTDSATFLVSGLCLAAVGTRASNSGPVDAGQTLFTMPAKRQVRGVIGKPTLPRSSLLLLATDGIGTFASNFMWLALPILATQASRSASIYSFAIGAAAIGGLLTSLALSGRLRQMAPLHVQSAGWFAVAICVMLLAAPAHSVLILLIAFIFGAGTCGASLGFDYYAADLTQEARHELYERDQLLLRCAGTGGILVTAAALSYAPTVSLIAAGALLIGFAGRTASAAQVKTNPPVAQGTGNEGVARAF